MKFMMQSEEDYILEVLPIVISGGHLVFVGKWHPEGLMFSAYIFFVSYDTVSNYLV
jgi:hypothetical protein